MSGRDHDAIEILRRELNFLEFGFYRAPTAGRPLFIFEDSPTCFRPESNCNDCVLLRFVATEYHSEPVPCRHIALNDAKETVDSFYRTRTPQELEGALRQWLISTIERLEQQEKQAHRPDRSSVRALPAKFA